MRRPSGTRRAPGRESVLRQGRGFPNSTTREKDAQRPLHHGVQQDASPVMIPESREIAQARRRFPRLRGMSLAHRSRRKLQRGYTSKAARTRCWETLCPGRRVLRRGEDRRMRRPRGPPWSRIDDRRRQRAASRRPPRSHSAAAVRRGKDRPDAHNREHQKRERHDREHHHAAASPLGAKPRMQKPREHNP